MKYIILLFTVLLHLPASGQPNDFSNRKQEIEKLTETVYSIKEFQRVADSLEMNIDELCDYPVIFPIKKPKRTSSAHAV